MTILVVLFLMGTYWFYSVLNWNTFECASVSKIRTFYIAAGVISILLAAVIRYQDIPKALSLLLRFAMPIFILNWVVGYIPIIPEDTHSLLIIDWFRYFALATAVLGYFRPTLFIPILLYTGIAKNFADNFYGVSISYTDYRPVLGALLFIFSGLILYGLFNLIFKKCFSEGKNKYLSYLQSFFAASGDSYYHPLNLLMFTGLSVYLASYYYSGLQKIILDNAGLYWPNSNTTYTLVLAGQLYNLFPISSLIKLCPWLFSVVYVTTPFVNWFSLLAELLALFSFSNKRFAQIVLLSLDLMHLGIFFLTGIFFWKWTLFNIALIVAIEKLPGKRFPLPILVASVLFMVLIARHNFFVVDLGWFDTRMIDAVQIEALTQDKKAILVPSNYFLINSVTYAQNRVGQSKSKGWGIVNTVHEAQQQNQCIQNTNPIKIDDAEFKSFSKQIRYHHNYVLAHSDSKGHFNYDFYPHHIWSDPFQHVAFSNLDKRKVTGYRLTLKSYCLDFKDNKLQKKLLGEDSRSVMLSELTRI